MSAMVQVSDRKQWRVLTLSGRVDAFCDKRIIESLKSAGEGASKLALHLENCDFLSIFALREILSWKDSLQREGSELILMSPSDSIHRYLDVFLGKSIPVHRSWERLEVAAFYQKSPVRPSAAAYLAPNH